MSRYGCRGDARTGERDVRHIQSARTQRPGAADLQLSLRLLGALAQRVDRALGAQLLRKLFELGQRAPALVDLAFLVRRVEVPARSRRGTAAVTSCASTASGGRGVGEVGFGPPDYLRVG
eukprot:4970987-Prymnesium_polylepis.2